MSEKTELTNDQKLQELRRIEQQYGFISPGIVMTEAQKPDALLHDEFEWDDSVASLQWRLQQARTLIRSVTIEHEVLDRRVTTVAYIRDPDRPANEQGYRSVQSLRNDESRARSAVTAEFDQASSRLKRARDLATALGLEDEIEGHINAIARTREKVAP